MAQKLPFSTIVQGLKVVIIRKVWSDNSGIRSEHIGHVFTVRSFDYGGRTHNKYISSIIVHSPKFGNLCAVIDELSLLNPNCEPEGEFTVCVGCGASMAECDMPVMHHIRGMRACPSCGILEPHES